MTMRILSTDEFKNAVQITREVYRGQMARLIRGGHLREVGEVANRFSLMDALLKDDDACEMLAGRVAQLQHGVRKETA
jgi:hypothetical protein